MNTAKVEQAIRMARTYAAEQLPWFSRALFSARLVLTTRSPSLAAVDDDMRVYFNTEFTSEMLRHDGINRAVRQLAFVWLHEISHVLREHPDRSRERNATPQQWNIAADLEINDSKWQGLEAPSRFPPLMPSNFELPEGKLAEFYYSHLPQGKTNGTESGELLGLAVPDEGSGVHGQTRSWELTDEDENSAGLSGLELEVLRQQVADSISSQKYRGVAPAGWLRWAESHLRPQINWQEQLKLRLRGAVATGIGARTDYSFRRPHRRSALYAPFIRPCLLVDRVPTIACVVDTSGSMSARDLGYALAEVRGVLNSLRTPITVIACDAVAYEPIQILTHADFLSLGKQLRGGGGTNMVAGIEAALALRPRPDAVIVLTDGYTPFPSRRYTTPVLFGIIKLTGYTNVPMPQMPPWRTADVIVLDTDVSDRVDRRFCKA